MSFHIWIPILLMPLILGFMLMLSVTRTIGSAVRWIVVWTSGFFSGGLLAWAWNTVFSMSYPSHAVWAAGGFLGLVVFSSLYGMGLEWVFWLSRHENNPYAGSVSLSPEQEADRVRFAKKLHWPAALTSACGGFIFAIALFPLIAGTRSSWPSLAVWAWLGGLGLAVQGLILGVFLGFQRRRVVFNASKNSLGEYLGWQIARTRKGGRAAIGWGLGYALHQLLPGIIAGAVLGGLTRLLLS